jgi:hypothetical protein
MESPDYWYKEEIAQQREMIALLERQLAATRSNAHAAMERVNQLQDELEAHNIEATRKK